MRKLIEHELKLIAELRYEAYFLTVHDIVSYARSIGILCQGRGSAANSVVCFCLGITEVDPDRMQTLVERFISKERNEPPDIDVDFEHERREEVIQYIYRKYSRERAALAATVITYRGRSAIRDVGKALGVGELQVSALARSLQWWEQRRHRRAADSRGGARSQEPEGAALDRARRVAARLPASSLAACGRFRHRRAADARARAHRECRDAGAHRHPMGQGRSRRARAHEGRCLGPRHAERRAPELRAHREILRAASTRSPPFRPRTKASTR